MENRKLNKRSCGSQYEEAAAHYLEGMGWKILKRNFRTRCGEIDLIARDGRYIVFVEVKYRSSGRRGLPAEAVDARKQRQIVSASLVYMMKMHLQSNQPVRYDVICVSPDGIDRIEDAFRIW